MFYLINNNIEAEGTIPYAEGYYRVKTNINLVERFWQPIGTQENAKHHKLLGKYKPKLQ